LFRLKAEPTYSERSVEMRTICSRAMAALAFVAALTPGAHGQQANVRHDLDGVWAVRPAAPSGRTAAAIPPAPAAAPAAPRAAFDCCLVDPRVRPPMTAWGQERFVAAVPSSRIPGPEGNHVIAGKENTPSLYT